MQLGGGEPQRIRVLGGLPALKTRVRSPAMKDWTPFESRAPRTRLFGGLLLGCSLLACEEQNQVPVSRARSDAVVAAPGTNPAPAPKAATDPKPTVPVTRGPLCSSKPNTPLPSAKVSGLGAMEQPFAGGAVGSRGPAWINLWAAWCEPCKKEIPLLRQFQGDLAKAGVPIALEFISIDDDRRQLQNFLDAQPSSGLKQTYWLTEGKEREEWLPQVGLSADPRLPVQLLVDAGGKIFCRVEGSIEESDFDAIKAIFSSR